MQLFFSGTFFTSRSFLLLSLLGANLSAIIFFIVQGGSVMQALWIYWLQSVVIGVVSVARILSLSLHGNHIISLAAALFFIFHYGFFHLVYAIFLAAYSAQEISTTINGAPAVISFNEAGISVGVVLLSGALFAMHHTMSFIAERRSEAAPHTLVHLADAVKRTLFRPYVRILPMHLIIILGPLLVIAVGANGVFVVFMVLKAIADVLLFRRNVSRISLPNPSLTTHP